MYLAGKHIPARGFQHFLGTLNLKKQIPPTELIDLVHRLKTGDTNALKIIIEGHMRLCMQIVGRYLTYFKYDLADDLVGEALLGLTETVHRAVTKLRDDYITPYIVASVHSCLSRFLRENKTVRVPARSQRHYKIGQVIISELTEESNIKQLEPDIFDAIEFYDLLDKACKTSVDREILRLRCKLFSDEEISKSIGLSRSTVAKLRLAIEQRLKELYHG